MGSYTSREISPGVYLLEDDRQSSCYLLPGSREALLIDTGMGEEPPLAEIRTLTASPISLLITHGHGDHARHADAFEPVYMHPADNGILPAAFSRLGLTALPDVARWKVVCDGQRLHIGGADIACVQVGGHTPGSMVYYEAARHLLFTGDALGSGLGVWMQLAGCLPLGTYRDNLRRLDAFWEGLPEDVLVLPGHIRQQSLRALGAQPVNRQTVCDLIHLCTLILDGREERSAAPEAAVRETRPAYTARWGRAAMVYTDLVIQ